MFKLILQNLINFLKCICGGQYHIKTEKRRSAATKSVEQSLFHDSIVMDAKISTIDLWNFLPIFVYTHIPLESIIYKLVLFHIP